MDDIRFALRTLAKNPGFTAVAVIALALGIGVNTAVFSITNGVLLRGQPFVSDRIYYLTTKNVTQNGDGCCLSYPDYRDWAAQSKSFTAIGVSASDQVNISDKSGFPTRYNFAAVSSNAFTIIGQKPILGRDFVDGDEKPGSTVLIISYKVWEKRFGKNPAVLGLALKVNNEPATIIGVMPKDFQFPGDTEVWRPVRPRENRGDRFLVGFGQLAPGVTQRSATVEMEGIGRNLEAAYSDTNKGIVPVVHTFNQEFNGDDTSVILASLMGAVSFVLLIACANVANLLLAKAVDRSREISIRIAIGSGRWRIVRQLLVESVILGIAGGLIGLGIAVAGLRVFETQVREQIPSWMQFWIDAHGLVYLAAISILTGILFGLAPALKLSRLDVNGALKDGGWGSSGGLRGKYLSGILVVVEMTLAVVLLSGAGLMIRSFVNVYSVNTGVNTHNVLVMRMLMPEAKYKTGDDRVAFQERLKARLSSIPGVEAVDIATRMPTGGSARVGYELEHAQPVDAKQRPRIGILQVGPDYFKVMDVSLRRGRTFTDIDGAKGQQPVTIVNQRFAEKAWPGEDAIGKRVRLFNFFDKPEDWLTVVGVAPDILQDGITTKGMAPLLYLPYRQRPDDDIALMARTRAAPLGLGETFRREVQTVDEDMPVYNLRTLDERLAQNYWEQKILGGLFGTFAVIALLLASVGLYAVISHSVSQRTQEIGVRMALGASVRNVLWLVFRQGMTQTVIGLLLGLAGAWGTTRILRGSLVNVTPTDPLTLSLVILILGTISTLGCMIPAFRATRVNPVVALRHE